jgi:hypothetical protein
MWYTVLVVGVLGVEKQVKDVRPSNDGELSVVAGQNETVTAGMTDEAMQASLAENTVEEGMRLEADRKRPLGPPRYSYIDVGAKWGNSLHLEQDVCWYTDCYQLCGSSSCGTSKPWDVIAIEATPFLLPYLEQLTTHLNGNGPAPRLFVPPGTSAESIADYAERYGCPSDSKDAVSNCIEQTFEKQLAWLNSERVSSGLSSAEEVNRRLDSAAAAANLARIPTTKYTLIPAVAGVENGDIGLVNLSTIDAVSGGAHTTKVTGKEQTVRQFDFIKWLINTFRDDDYVFVKMDTDTDTTILNELIDHHYSARNLIDTLVINCNGEVEECEALSGKIRTETHINLITGYAGHDSQSSPFYYKPIDPRPVKERALFTVQWSAKILYLGVKFLLVNAFAFLSLFVQGLVDLALAAQANPKLALCVVSSITVSVMATYAALGCLAARKEGDVFWQLRSRVQAWTKGRKLWRKGMHADEGS